MENQKSKRALDYLRECVKKSREKEPENIYDRLARVKESQYLFMQYLNAGKECEKRKKKEITESLINQNCDEINTNPYPKLDYRDSYEKKNN